MDGLVGSQRRLDGHEGSHCAAAEQNKGQKGRGLGFRVSDLGFGCGRECRLDGHEGRHCAAAEQDRTRAYQEQNRTEQESEREGRPWA